MTFWVEQHTILLSVTASFASPDKVMTVPACYLGDLLVADWTEAVLLLPKGEELAFSAEIGFHVDIEPFFKVLFPAWVIRIGLVENFVVPFDFDTTCTEKFYFSDPLFIYKSSEEYPVSVAAGFEVFLLDPSLSLGGMSSFCPSPQCLEDCIAYLVEGFAAHHVPVIVHPTS